MKSLLNKSDVNSAPNAVCIFIKAEALLRINFYSNRLTGPIKVQFMFTYITSCTYPNTRCHITCVDLLILSATILHDCSANGIGKSQNNSGETLLKLPMSFYMHVFLHQINQ